MSRRRSSPFLNLSWLGASILGSALGIGDPPTAYAQDESLVKLEEVTVTARKRTENEQDVPTSITALTAQDIQNFGLKNVEDIAFAIPNFSWSHLTALSNTLCIRGVCSDSSAPGFDTSIAIILDDVYVGRAAGFATNLLDIDRIEVLRGPQGTLQGRNVTGGVVNISSSRPTDQFEGVADVSYGNYNQVVAQTMVSGPIFGDAVTGKLALSRRSHDGFGENTDLDRPLDTEDSWAIRGQLRLRPFDNLEVLLTSDYDHFNNHDFHNSYGPPDVSSPPPEFFTRKVGGNIWNYGDRDVHGSAINIYWNLPLGMTFASITSERGYSVVDVQDASGMQNFGSAGAGTFVGTAREDQNQSQFSQELRLSSREGGPVSWIGGLYYYWEKLHDYQNFLFGTNTGTVLNGGASISDADTFTDSRAGFGSVTYKPTDFWVVTAGARYTVNARHTAVNEILGEDGTALDANGQPFQYVNMPTVQDPVPETFLAPVDYGVRHNWLEDKAWTRDLSVTERWTDSVSTYLKYAHGFKGGGFNANFNYGYSAGIVKPEFVDSYEAGFRSTWLDDRLRFNATVFYLDQRDQQVLVFDEADFVYVTSNAPRTRSYGSEWDLQAAINHELTATLALGTTHARFTAGEWSGNSVPLTSPVDVTATLNYVKTLPHDLEFFAFTDINWHGAYYLSPDNIGLARQKDYWWLDGRLGLQSDNHRWSAALYVRNALDTNVLASASNVPGLYSVGFLEEPRTYGVDVRIKF